MFCKRRLTFVLLAIGIVPWRLTSAVADSSNAAVVQSAKAVAGKSNFVGMKTYVTVIRLPRVSGR